VYECVCVCVCASVCACVYVSVSVCAMLIHVACVLLCCTCAYVCMCVRVHVCLRKVGLHPHPAPLHHNFEARNFILFDSILAGGNC
jgi:hypothetical protein